MDWRWGDRVKFGRMEMRGVEKAKLKWGWVGWSGSDEMEGLGSLSRNGDWAGGGGRDWRCGTIGGWIEADCIGVGSMGGDQARQCRHFL